MSEKIQLSQERINQLYKFVRRKYVPFIDVQYEIVDHLASAIEDDMSKDSSLQFDQALENIYSKFPITGFAQLQIEKENMLRKYWWTRIIDYLKLFFTPPRVVLTLLLTGLMYLVFSAGNNLSFVIISGGFVLLGMFANKFSYKETRKEMNKYLVFKSYYHAINKIIMTAFAIPMLVMYQSEVFLKINLEPILLFCSFYYALSIIVTYAVFIIFPRMMFIEINTKYQHLKVA